MVGGGMGGWVGGWPVCEAWVDGVMGDLIIIYKYIIISLSENYFKLRYFWLSVLFCILFFFGLFVPYFQHTYGVGIR